MSNIDVFIRTEDGNRLVLASLNNAQEVREMHDLLCEVGVAVGGESSRSIEIQAVIDDDDVGFEFIVMF